MSTQGLKIVLKEEEEEETECKINGSARNKIELVWFWNILPNITAATTNPPEDLLIWMEEKSNLF